MWQCTIMKVIVIHITEMQTLRRYDQSIIVAPFDEKGTTLGHITARSGSVNLFKVNSLSLVDTLSLLSWRVQVKRVLMLAILLHASLRCMMSSMICVGAYTHPHMMRMYNF